MEKVRELVACGTAACLFGVAFYLLALTCAATWEAMLADFLLGSGGVTLSAVSFYMAGMEYDRAFVEQKIRRQVERECRRESRRVAL